MAARVCKGCGLNYSIGISTCDVCGGKLSFSLAESVHEDIEERAAVVRATIATAGTIDQKVVLHRHNRLLSLGLDHEHAMKLADLRDYTNGGFVVDIHRFEDLRKQGCSADLAAAILG